MAAMNGKKKPTNYDTDNDGIDTEEEERNGKDPSKMSSAEKRKRRMSYQPPRRNSMHSVAGNRSPNPQQQGSQLFNNGAQVEMA